MESRMKKYYTEELKEDAQRTKKNAPLYRQIYGAYDEFENLKLPVSDNEIDITDIGTSVTSREEYRKMKEYGSITNKSAKIVKEEHPEEVKVSAESNNRVYNINEMLASVKGNRSNMDDNVVNTSANYLHTLQTDEEIKTDLEKVKEMYNKISEEFDKEEEMDRMSDVSTGTLSLELLSDLKSDKDTEVMPGFKDDKSPTGDGTKSSSGNSEQVPDRANGDNGNDLDNTFYGGGYQFNKKDFNDDNFFDGDMDKKGHYVIKSLLVIVLIVLLVGCALYFLDKYNVINLF